MNETTPSKEKQARPAQARAADRAESSPAPPPDTRPPGTDAPGRDPEAVKEDPDMDEDVHEAHREVVPIAPLGH